jgi:hypothetical protein
MGSTRPRRSPSWGALARNDDCPVRETPGGDDQEECFMAHVARAGFDTFLAFGAAALAVAEVAALVGGQLPEGSTRELLDDLEAAHHRLRVLFDLGEDADVYDLGLSVLMLAERTTEAYRESRGLTGS